MASKKIEQLQLLQQNLQTIALQKQQIEEQLTELSSALTELKSTDKAYKIVGKIMIASPKDILAKDIEEKTEMAKVRLSSFSKQEENIKKSMEETQKEVMEELKKEK